MTSPRQDPFQVALPVPESHTCKAVNNSEPRLSQNAHTQWLFCLHIALMLVHVFCSPHQCLVCDKMSSINTLTVRQWLCIYILLFVGECSLFLPSKLLVVVLQNMFFSEIVHSLLSLPFQLVIFIICDQTSWACHVSLLLT